MKGHDALEKIKPHFGVARNGPCACGSGFKSKHCCEAFKGSTILKPTNAELELLAIEADDEGLADGEEPKQRSFLNVMRILKKLGVDGVVLIGEGTPLIVERVRAANQKLFRPTDIQSGGIHLGLYMFRDFFCRFYVPIGFGTFSVDMWQFIDLSDNQKKWLASRKDELAKFTDQSFDLFDFGWGFLEFGHSRPANATSKELIYRAHVHLEAAAATATSAYDYRGTLQSALLGAEMAVKAGLAFHGYEDDQLRFFGHDLEKAAKELGEVESSFDSERVVKAVRSFPSLVQSRYGGPSPSRIETGEIVMKAQYIASEVTRTFTDRDFRKNNVAPTPRHYP